MEISKMEISIFRNDGVTRGFPNFIITKRWRRSGNAQFRASHKSDGMISEMSQDPPFYTTDSFKFMATSLEKLVNNLPKDDCINLGSYYSGNKFNLLARKGVYPYEYMDSLEKLKETALPPKEAFYSRLNDGGISDEDYAHAQNVWKTFKMKSFKDYHELYNKVDVLLLADVFENFRNICLTNYGLDPAHYYTAPGLAWDAALKVTGVSLELLSDVDMLLMIEKGIRGGVSIISNRYAKANNKYMGESFIDTMISIYIAYLDSNNLYGSPYLRTVLNG